jgi:hypothetical protein
MAVRKILPDDPPEFDRIAITDGLDSVRRAITNLDKESLMAEAKKSTKGKKWVPGEAPAATAPAADKPEKKGPVKRVTANSSTKEKMKAVGDGAAKIAQKAKAEAAAPAPKKGGKGKTANTDGLISLSDLCDEMDIDPRSARIVLRAAGKAPKDKRYAWPRDSKELEAIKKLLKGE